MDCSEIENCEVSPEVCRLCLKTSKILKSMFHCTIGTQSYADIYEICTGFAVILSTELPNRVCNDCEANLISYHNFRLAIESVEEKIQIYQSKLDQKSFIEEISFDVPEDEQPEEQFVENDEQFLEVMEVEQLSESVVDEEYFELEDQETTSSCRFIPSTTRLKLVKCLTCTEECEYESTINSSKPEEEIPLQCECGNVYKNRRSFLKHFATIHEKRESNFNCRKCEETFTTWRARLAHEAKVHNLGYKHECFNCKKNFFRSDRWKEHEKSCAKALVSTGQFFSCSVCLYTFQREDTFKKHLETAHLGANEGDDEYAKRAEDYAQRYSSRKSAVANSDETDPVKGPACEICKQVFKNESSLSKHVSTIHTNQVWSCNECGEKFLHRSTKISHMSKVHGDRKPFECSEPDCGFSCFKKDRFCAHMEKHKDPEKQFSCPICQQEFKSYNSMTVHRARHLTRNALVCPTCSKQFLDKRNYNTHLKLHTQEDLFHCEVCSRGFVRKDHLTKHQKRKNHFVDK